MYQELLLVLKKLFVVIEFIGQIVFGIGTSFWRPV